MVNDFVPTEPNCYDVRSWPCVYEPAEEHLATITQRADALAVNAPSTRLMSCLAGYLHTRGDFAEAEPLMRRALAIDEYSFGPDHPNVARDLNNLAALLQATNRMADAEPLMRRAVGILTRFRLRTGHWHPHGQIFDQNYRRMLKAMGVPPEEIERRFREIEEECR
jgi:hypothetical protein